MKRHVLYLLTGLLAAIAPQAMGGPIVVGAPTTSVPTYLSDGTYLFPPGVTVALTGSQFLLPIQITGAIELQSWVFDLLFESTVVQEVDPLDGSAGIYGAEFISGDSASLSFILGGFPFNVFGSVSGIGGRIPHSSADLPVTASWPTCCLSLFLVKKTAIQTSGSTMRRRFSRHPSRPRYSYSPRACC
jgi:hypothetical protein